MVSSDPVGDLLIKADAAFESGLFSDAVKYYQDAHVLAPDDMKICAQLGVSLARSGDFVTAQGFLIKGLRAKPNDAMLLNVLGLAYGQTGNFQDAETCYRKLIRFGGGDDLTFSNLGSSLNELGRFDEAERLFKTSLRRQPGHAISRYNLGLLQLLRQDFEQGWHGFELRNAAKGIAEREFPGVARWQGEDVDGRTLLLYAEQGLGDTIQFARFATLLAAHGAKIVIQCDDALAELMLTIDGVTQAGGSFEVPGGVDFYTSLLSLPMLLETTVETIPNISPYMSASSLIPDAALLKDKSEGTKLRIGLVWAGNPKHQSDRTRSIKLNLFEPLLCRSDVDVYSLQAGESVNEIDQFDVSHRPRKMFNTKRPLLEVAAAMQHLDLVISVDTSLAHLAGALDVPIWTLISFYPDWRWMLERSDSPWYPTMRLFRQPALGDWDAVIKKIGYALDELTALT